MEGISLRHYLINQYDIVFMENWRDLKNTTPIREMVAGEAWLRSWVSKMKLTLGPNWMRSPDAIVSSRLSSRTELRASIHSGSMSPSQITQEVTSVFNHQQLLNIFILALINWAIQKIINSSHYGTVHILRKPIFGHFLPSKNIVIALILHITILNPLIEH